MAAVQFLSTPVDISEHSHPIGLTNLPFTRRGRRAAVEAEKSKNKRHSQVPPPDPSSSTNPVTTPTVPAPPPPPQQQQQPQPQPQPPMPGFPTGAPLTGLPHPFSHYPPPPGITHQYPPLPIVAAPQQGSSAQQDAWDRMSVLFNTIRGHARTFEYPAVSFAALESVLLRLYIESPVNVVGGLAPGIHPCPMPQQQSQAQPSHAQEPHSQAPANGSSATAEQGNEIESSIESG